jgi:spore maturation protein CgeB
MKLLLVHPGASWSVADVWRGFFGAFQRAGVEVVQYALDGRVSNAHGYLHHAWRTARKTRPDLPKPTDADTLYMGSVGLIERALRHQPDWTLLVSGTFIHPEALMLAQRAGIRMAALLTESPYADDQERQVVAFCKLAFTNERASIPTFSDIVPTYYWRHSHDPEQHRPAPAAEEPDCPAHDVVFVGTGFEERVAMLAGVDWAGLGIDLGLYGAWDLVGSRSKLRRFIRAGIIDNRLTAALYRRAKIGLNLHRTSIGFGRNVPHAVGAQSMNPRDLELAACGTFYLADRRAELEETFGPLVPTFETPQELADQVQYWLDPAHAAQRQWRAASLPGAACRLTFDAQARAILNVLEGAPSHA